MLRHTLPRTLPRSLVLGVLAVTTWFASVALADPGAVARILRQSGSSGVARGPQTVDNATKTEIEDLARTAAQKTGAKFHVVLVAEGTPLAPYAELYQELGLSGKDVLIVSDGPKWDLRANALSKEAKQDLLKSALQADGKPLEKMERLTEQVASAVQKTKTAASAGSGKLTWNEFEHANAGKGWSGARMSSEYQSYRKSVSTGETTSSTEVATTKESSSSSSSTPWFGAGFLALVVGGIVTWVVVRRRKRDEGLGLELKKALAAPESTMTDVYMNLDGLENHPKFGQLMDAATKVTEEVDALKAGPASRESVARAQALQQEAQRVRTAFDNARMQR